MKIAALAGGVGGSKLCAGLADVVNPKDLTIIVNIADDFDYYGLRICPDLDTVCYTLAGINNPATGWGLEGETWNLASSLKTLGGEAWFNLGDRDAATHLLRTQLLKSGLSLTEVARRFCDKWGIAAKILPASDDRVATIVQTDDGRCLPFQEYFVKEHFEPGVKSFEFKGITDAKASREVLANLEDADWIIICPSNPWVSIDPILYLNGVKEALANKKILAVSPLINGKALKGPAAKMYAELGYEPGATAVAEHYRNFIKAFVLDSSDENEEKQIARWGIITLLTDIRMPIHEERRRLANELLAFCKTH